MTIGITGPTGAGKTTAAKYLAATHGLFYLRYSEVLAEMSPEPTPDRQTLREFGWDIMSRRLQSSLNERLLRKMRTGINYVIDGLRHPVDFDTLSSHPPFYLFYIDASRDIRWQRLAERYGNLTWEEFLAGDNHPVEGHLPLLRRKAHCVLQNEGSESDFIADLDNTFKQIDTVLI